MGKLKLGQELILRYGFSDAGIRVARVSMADLLRELTLHRPRPSEPFKLN